MTNTRLAVGEVTNPFKLATPYVDRNNTTTMPLKSVAKELQKMCKDRGLSTGESKAQLIGRLEDDERSRVLLSPNSQDTGCGMDCDAILVASSEVGGEEEMKTDAKSTLGQALEEEELCVEEVRGELVVGNRRGLRPCLVAPGMGLNWGFFQTVSVIPGGCLIRPVPVFNIPTP
jgi:hypothetical protein